MPAENVSKPACPICNDAGWVSVGVDTSNPDWWVGRLVPCECKAHEITAKMQKISRLSPIEQETRLRDMIMNGRPDTTRMIKAAVEFVKQPVGFLTIHGGYGNGKTMSLISITNELVNHGVQAIYITFYELLSWTREAYEVDGESEWMRLNSLLNVPVLCIDEIDKAKVTDWSRQTLTHVVDRRYRDRENTGTVFAFNGRFESIQESWLRSRLQEGVIIENNDPDVRKGMQS